MYLNLMMAVVCEVAATLSMRQSQGFRRRGWLVPMGIGYLAAFWFLGRSLAAGMPVGLAYGIWAAAGVASVAILSRILWGDALTRRVVAGIVLIITGVMLVELG